MTAETVQFNYTTELATCDFAYPLCQSHSYIRSNKGFWDYVLAVPPSNCIVLPILCKLLIMNSYSAYSYLLDAKGMQ